jgi:uncharacterized damage-inducible protein DinB
MLTTRSARMFARYNAWADKVMFDAVAELPPGEADKERRTLFKTMVRTLNHNYLIDVMWQAHIEGRDHGFARRDVVLHPELGKLWDAQQAMNRWFTDWADAQSEAALAEECRFTLTGGNTGMMTRGEVLFHVINHHTYHRGWVCEMFFEVPRQPPTLDLPVYRREMAHEFA